MDEGSGSAYILINSFVFASGETTYSFTAQFLCAAMQQASEAKLLENSYAAADITEDVRCAHRGYVVGALMQSVAALESEIWALTQLGVGFHLGSNGLDQTATKTVLKWGNTFDKLSTAEKYKLLLQILGKGDLDFGSQPGQDAQMAIELRNELVHYKALTTSKLDQKKLFNGLKSLKLKPPPFQETVGVNFFPHLCLSAECAEWSIRTCVKFLDHVYLRLGVASPLVQYKSKLKMKYWSTRK